MQAIVRQLHKATSAPTRLRIEMLTGGVEVIERLAAEWRALCAEGRYTAPFYQPEWIAAYLQAFAADKTLLVVTARRHGRLRAVLPLVTEWTTLHGVPVRKLRSPSNIYTCRFDVVAGRGEEAEAVVSLWQALQQRGGWDVIELSEVPEGGLGERLLTQAARASFPTGRWATSASPYLALAPLAGTTDAQMEATLQSVSAKFRASLRRSRRRLEEQAKVQVSCDEVATPTELTRFYALESAGWKGREGTAIACDDRARQFYTSVARANAAQGKFLLYRMDCGEQTIAMRFCLRDAHTCYLIKPNYDEGFRKYSPGHLLFAEVARDAMERGLEECDLLPPESEWKSYWTKTARAQAHCYIFRRGSLGQALHTWKFHLLAQARRLKQWHNEAMQDTSN